MAERVLMTTTDGVCHIRLNRGDKMNALDPAMFEGITAALETLAASGNVRAIVLSGEGDAFCAGLDLGSFGLQDDAPSDLVPRTHGKANWVQNLGWGWRQLPVPVISAVHGVCFGGGLQLMAGSDIKVIHPDTRCAVMAMRWGLVPDMSGYPLWRGNVRDDILRRLSTPMKFFRVRMRRAMVSRPRLTRSPLLGRWSWLESLRVKIQMPSAPQKRSRI